MPLVLAGCAGAPPVPAPPTTASTTAASTTAASTGVTLGERAAVIAAGQVGVPYRYGGYSHEGFDCSGLVSYAYARAGQPVPRTTRGLWHELDAVNDADLEVGDVLFFEIEGKASHVGLYLGSGRFVHAPSTGREVTIAELGSDYYRRAFIRAGRP